MRFTLKADLKPEEAARRVKAAASDGIADALEHVLGVSNQAVPLEYGDLMASGATAVDGLEGAISYGTPYAVVQHEDTSLRHKNGRKAKYLEDALNSERQAILNFIGKKIQGALS